MICFGICSLTFLFYESHFVLFCFVSGLISDPTNRIWLTDQFAYCFFLNFLIIICHFFFYIYFYLLFASLSLFLLFFSLIWFFLIKIIFCSYSSILVSDITFSRWNFMLFFFFYFWLFFSTHITSLLWSNFSFLFFSGFFVLPGRTRTSRSSKFHLSYKISRCILYYR